MFACAAGPRVSVSVRFFCQRVTLICRTKSYKEALRELQPNPWPATTRRGGAAGAQHSAQRGREKGNASLEAGPAASGIVQAACHRSPKGVKAARTGHRNGDLARFSPRFVQTGASALPGARSLLSPLILQRHGMDVADRLQTLPRVRGHRGGRKAASVCRIAGRVRDRYATTDRHATDDASLRRVARPNPRHGPTRRHDDRLFACRFEAAARDRCRRHEVRWGASPLSAADP